MEGRRPQQLKREKNVKFLPSPWTPPFFGFSPNQREGAEVSPSWGDDEVIGRVLCVRVLVLLLLS